MLLAAPGIATSSKKLLGAPAELEKPRPGIYKRSPGHDQHTPRSLESIRTEQLFLKTAWNGAMKGNTDSIASMHPSSKLTSLDIS